MFRKGTVVKSKAIGCVEEFVGVIEEVFVTRKRRRYYHVRDRDTGKLWHRDRDDLTLYLGGKNVRRARPRRDRISGVCFDHDGVTP